MAMEIPVIASDLPALRELVAPGRRGEVFAPDDPDSLADTAGRLLDSPDLRKARAQEAKEWILEERTLESNAKRYGEILSRVMDTV
jgi:glycosyltransferase involved in cell wall biosynthesis